jgi:hypothetical protein
MATNDDHVMTVVTACPPDEAAPGSVYSFRCHILIHLMNPGQAGDEMGGLIALIEYTK